MTGHQKGFTIEESHDAKKTPRRIAFIKQRTSARVKREDETMVMTVPNLVIREIIAFEVMVIVLAIISLLFNAPLEWIANPDHTPNPAKAPWYFLGLQELLHYFPPVVGGVILPTLTVIALIVIPYFNVNIKGEGLWQSNAHQTFLILTITTGVITVLLLMFKVYVMAVPTLLVAGTMVLPYLSKKREGIIGWLASRSLPWWIMTWFVLIVVVLTTVGTLFRGPGWSWTWPWEGIY
jgi:menaquinol-cytochrome c reductase cytochrome b/c subunit